MHIGIYIKDYAPHEGGASTFMNSSRKWIESIKSEYELSLCYEGALWGKVVQENDNLRIININAFKRKYYLFFLGKILILALRRLCRILILKPDIHEKISVLDKVAEKYAIDIYWFTFPGFADLSTPYIYTLWDLGHRTMQVPETTYPLNLWIGKETLNKTMLEKAAYIIIGNETGKEEILNGYKINPYRIRVAEFETPNLNGMAEKKPDKILPEEFFLYPAQFWSHKNHIRILEAAYLLKNEGIYINVVFTGSDKGNREYIERKAKEYGIDNQIYFLGFVPDGELKYLYMHAKALIFASVLGPNNLPPLEALSLDCPVIISDIPGHREEMQEAALYFNPYSGEDLRDKIKSFLTDEELRRCLAERAQDRQKKQQQYNYVDIIKKIFDEYYSIKVMWDDK